MQFGKHNRWVGWWYSRPVLVVLALMAVLLLVSVIERIKVEREMAARSAAAEAELHQLEAREVELHKRVEYLEGARGVEEEIRKNFDVARAGEQVVILTGEPSVPPPSVPPPSPKYPWYQFWR
jgi:cell division protein FtsB